MTMSSPRRGRRGAHGGATIATHPKTPGPTIDGTTPWDSILVAFCDLDQTFYPSDDLDAFERNIAAADALRRRGVDVVYATGNNLALAKAKFARVPGGIAQVVNKPGIYCNGALVYGQTGALVKDVVNPTFVSTIVDAWDQLDEPWCVGCGLMGLGADRCYAFAQRDGHTMPAASRRFIDHMRVDAQDVTLVSTTRQSSRATFAHACNDVLSLVLLLPHHDGDEHLQLDTKEKAQAWLARNGFTFHANKTGEHTAFRVSCKHVHASKHIGPEIDISPTGINKGSAVIAYLENAFATDERPMNQHIAAFGDALNDMELFAFPTRQPIHRPIVRVAMPGRSHEAIETDATHVAECHEVFQRIIASYDATMLDGYMRYETYVRTMRRLMESLPEGAFTLYPRDVRDESLAQIANEAEETPATIEALIGEVRDEVVAEMDEVARALGVEGGALARPWSRCDADEAFKTFFGLPVTDTDDAFDDEYHDLRHALEAMEIEVAM